MEKAKIKFPTGEEIEVEQNGSSFIADSKPDFPKKITSVTISNKDGDVVISNAELIECAGIDDRYWFSFIEVPQEERTAKKMQANIEYIAMMTDVELEA